MDSVVGLEVDGVANVADYSPTISQGNAGKISAVDVLDSNSSKCSSIALPQFFSCGSVAGKEIEGVANGRDGGRVTAVISTVDVLEHDGAIGCSIALPQFATMDSIVGLKV